MKVIPTQNKNASDPGQSGIRSPGCLKEFSFVYGHR